MKYTCITIGPIVATLEKARKTRETWAASFLFSRVMKELVKGIEHKDNIIIPYRERHKELFHVGLYPDHLIYWNEEEEDKLEVEDLVEKAKKSILDSILSGENCEVNEEGKTFSYTRQDVSEFLDSYIQISYFTLDLNNSQENGEKKKNFLEEIDDIFNAVELQTDIQQETKFHLADFFRMIPAMPLYYREAEFTNGLSHCRSLMEIATADFWEWEEYKHLAEEIEQKAKVVPKTMLDEEDFMSRIKRMVGKKFKSYYNYVAVVQSDGDRMGRFNRGYIDYYIRLHPEKSPEQAIQKVSDALFAWGEEAVGLISSFRGLPIYAGGDDLFFFAPVVRSFCREESDEEQQDSPQEMETIIDLLEKISILFKEKMQVLAGKGSSIELPSLSFGVSIAFYKYPLGESHQQALNLMYEMKRVYQGNGVNMTLLKHSGSDFRFQLHLQPLRHNEKYSWYSIYQHLMKVEIDKEMLSSVSYHLQENVRVIDEIADSEERIRQFFIHKIEGFPAEKEISELGYQNIDGEKRINFLLEVEKLVKLAFIDHPLWDKDGKYINRMLPVFDMLRIVKFFKGLDEKH